MQHDIFFKSIVSERVKLKPHELHRAYKDVIEEKLKRDYEGRCSRHGYIRRGSVQLYRVSAGRLETESLNGDVNFTVLYKCEVCNPVKGATVASTVVNTNKFGVLTQSGTLVDAVVDSGGEVLKKFVPVLEIVVPKQVYVSDVDLERVAIGDTLNVEVLGKKFRINGSKIQVTARAVSHAAEKRDEELRMIDDPEEFEHDDNEIENDVNQDEFVRDDDDDDGRGAANSDDDDESGAGGKAQRHGGKAKDGQCDGGQEARPRTRSTDGLIARGVSSDHRRHARRDGRRWSEDGMYSSEEEDDDDDGEEGSSGTADDDVIDEDDEDNDDEHDAKKKNDKHGVGKNGAAAFSARKRSSIASNVSRHKKNGGGENAASLNDDGFSAAFYEEEDDVGEDADTPSVAGDGSGEKDADGASTEYDFE